MGGREACRQASYLEGESVRGFMPLTSVPFHRVLRARPIPWISWWQHIEDHRNGAQERPFSRGHKSDRFRALASRTAHRSAPATGTSFSNLKGRLDYTRVSRTAHKTREIVIPSLRVRIPPHTPLGNLSSCPISMSSIPCISTDTNLRLRNEP